jgi:hypothetical protein
MAVTARVVADAYVPALIAPVNMTTLLCGTTRGNISQHPFVVIKRTKLLDKRCLIAVDDIGQFN